MWLGCRDAGAGDSGLGSPNGAAPVSWETALSRTESSPDCPSRPGPPENALEVLLPTKKSSADRTQNAPDADDLLYWPQAKQG